MSGGGFTLPFSTGNLDMNGLSNAAHTIGLFYTPLSFHRLWYIFEPSFICCLGALHAHTYVLILVMTPALDCETYCVTVSDVIPLNVTAPLSYRILILLLKEFSSVVFNLEPCRGLNFNSSRELSLH